MRRFAPLLLLLILPVIAFGLTGKAGPYRVDLVSDPSVLPVGKATLDVYITDGTGKPVGGATVKAIAQMPNMPMGEREQTATPTGAEGHYRFTQAFSMAGDYDARISITGPLGSATAAIPMETGKPTATTAEGASPALSAWPWILGVGLVALVLLSMRKTGQRINLRQGLTAQTIGSLLFLGIVAFGAVYAVNHFRRVGAMTPIEAQTMNMDMPPPEGVLPVTLATVEEKSIGATVRYSGQAAGYSEQAVNARTSGVIVWMPAYIGTVVHKGEIVARLDTTQLAPQVAQGRAMVDSAKEGVGVAEADYRQAQAMIHQAESERGQFEGAVAEAEANLAAAKDGREVALAGVASAQADVKDAQAQAASARADQRYWVEELKRENSLFTAGAVSRDEYEREKADAAKSEAAVRQADEQVRSAQAKVASAQAEARRASSGILAAQRKIDQAKAGLMAHHAHIQTAQAEAASAQRKIAQSEASVRQAQAGLQSVAAQAGYAEIRAEIDGVVTERTISPGTLVSPGQTILKISQLDPIRLQANVPAADLARMRVGQPVGITHAEGTGRSATGRISSISPAIDPVSRTGMVEVVMPNRDRSFLPGQFLTMSLPVGVQGMQRVIPQAAVQTSVSDGLTVQAAGTADFVWVATPVVGQAGRFTVSRRLVELGDRTADQVAIKSGLEPGEKVVLSGGTGLSEGNTVSELGGSPAAAASTEISITESGFEPASLTISAGGPRQITFTRKTNDTCAKQVVFPSLRITKDLPLNVPVVVELPPSVSGTIDYACGMNMLKGKVVVQ